jgi:hypothetical protein
LRHRSITRRDPSADFVASVAINEALKSKSNGFGSAGNDTGGDELVYGRRELVLDPRYQLCHAVSITKRNATEKGDLGIELVSLR